MVHITTALHTNTVTMNPKLGNKCPVYGKIIYSESAATRAVQQVEGAERYYRCKVCNGYHITSWKVHKNLEKKKEVKELVPNKKVLRLIKKLEKKLNNE